MELDKLSPVVLEVWAVHEAFRRLGFVSDDLFVVWCNPPPCFTKTNKPVTGAVEVLLKTQGKEFVCAVGVVDMTRESFETEWRTFIQAFNAHEVPDSFLRRVWESSHVVEIGPALIMTLLAKGFELNKSRPRPPKKAMN